MTSPKKNKSVASQSSAKRSSSQAPLQNQFGLIAPHQQAKNYVLDTNVLLHDPAALHRFKDNHLCILVDVIAELDKFKSEQTERGANARRVHRKLTELFANAKNVTDGVTTPDGGTIRFVIYDPIQAGEYSQVMEPFFRILPDKETVDHRILAATLLIMQCNTNPVTLVTKDLNMQLKARAAGIHCEDYMNDKVDAHEASNFDVNQLTITPSEMQRFTSTGELSLPENQIAHLHINEYLLLSSADKTSIPARLHPHGYLVKLNVPDALKIPNGQSLKPLNLGQRFLIDALLNPDISLVTCFGHAGTGKTLIAVAAGLHEIFNRRYSGMTVSRPVVAMGDQLGFLPGTLDEKMRPWLQPIHDALDLIMRPSLPLGPRRKQIKPATNGSVIKKPYELLMEQGVLDIEALCYIRGRSIPNRFFILDEAQQITPQEAKTVVTRMSKDSKLVMVGDPAQIDHPYVDSRSNGLVYTRNRLKGQAFTAHVALKRGERSELAEAGAQLM